MVTVAFAAPSTADAVGPLNATVKVFVPVNGVAFEIGTDIVLAAASPEAQERVPLTLV